MQAFLIQKPHKESRLEEQREKAEVRPDAICFILTCGPEIPVKPWGPGRPGGPGGPGGP